MPTPQRKSAEALRDELTALDDQTLVSKLEDVIEAQHFLNQSRFFATSADYEYWVKLATWEIYQATALLLGRRPDDIDITAIENHSHDCIFAKKYVNLFRLIENWHWKPELPRTSGPREFLAWAKKFQVSVPEGLSSAFEEVHTLENMERDVELNDLPARSKSAATKERNSILKLVLGIAKAQYGYDPNPARSSTTTQICEDLDSVGLSLDPQTIRKILKEAADIHWEAERE